MFEMGADVHAIRGSPQPCKKCVSAWKYVHLTVSVTQQYYTKSYRLKDQSRKETSLESVSELHTSIDQKCVGFQKHVYACASADGYFAGVESS